MPSSRLLQDFGTSGSLRLLGNNSIFMAIQEIQRLEQAAANALPPSLLRLDEGWRLRADGGGARRANSVLAEYHSLDTSLNEKIDRAEAFYKRLGKPARFQLCPTSQPLSLDDLLAERGYRTSSGAVVQRAPLTKVLARVVKQAIPDAVVELNLSSDWLSLYAQATGVKGYVLEAKRTLFGRIPSLSAFVTVRLAGIPAAVVLGVLEEGQLGVFNMATLPSLRRRGAARSIIHALAIWGAQMDARMMYLQVAEENLPARALYTQLGFQTLYAYHYREAS